MGHVALASSPQTTALGTVKRPPAWTGGISLQHLLFYAVLANIPMWIAQRAVGLVPMGWFNVDFLAIGVLSLFLPRFISMTLLTAAILVDFLVAICRTYFLLPGEVAAYVSAVSQMSARRIAGFFGIAILVAVVAGASMFLRRPAKGRKATAAAFVLFALLLSADNHVMTFVRSGHWFTTPDIAHDSPHDIRRRSIRFPARWLTDPGQYSWVRPRLPEPEHIEADTTSAFDADSRFVFGSAPDQTHPDIVLIVVESWGLPLDPALRDALVAAYPEELVGGYRILQGAVPFNGPTIPGEVRELCDSKAGFHILDASASEMTKCLPMRLSALGYQTTAVHGMSGWLFHRQQWYPRLGFQEILFRNQLESLGLPNCPGAFQGTCDSAIADWIGRRLEAPSSRPRFIYWMTLNSHLPVPDRISISSPAPCTAVHSDSDRAAVCTWFQLVENVHRSIAAIAARRLARPTTFIVVGDHAPPFADPGARNQFDPGRVPYVILEPNVQLPTNSSKSRMRAAIRETPSPHHGE